MIAALSCTPDAPYPRPYPYCGRNHKVRRRLPLVARRRETADHHPGMPAKKMSAAACRRYQTHAMAGSEPRQIFLSREFPDNARPQIGSQKLSRPTSLGRPCCSGSPRRSGALPTSSTSALLGSMEAAMSAKKQPRDQVSARLDPEVRKIVERVAAVERRPISAVVRNVIEDWAKVHNDEVAA